MKVLSDITELERKYALIVGQIIKTWSTANITSFVAFYGLKHVFYTKRYPQFSQRILSNKKHLSSGLTFYMKFIMPTVFLGFLLFMALFGFISGEPMGGIAGLFGTGIFGLVFYLLFMRLKRVRMDEQYFYISNFWRTEKLPISDLIEVSAGHFINAQRIWLTFRTDEPLNKSFLFMPYFSFGAIFSTHPTVKELLLIVKKNREEHVT